MILLWFYWAFIQFQLYLYLKLFFCLVSNFITKMFVFSKNLFDLLMFMSDIVFTSTEVFEIYFPLRTYLDLWHFQLIFEKKKCCFKCASWTRFVVLQCFCIKCQNFSCFNFHENKKFSNKNHCVNSTAML